MNGVIWNKMQESFVPISSVPVYAAMQQKRLRQSRELETHNFQLQNVTLTAFQEKGFLEFYDNNTKIRGFCADIWIFLAQALNFTLQPVRSHLNDLGLLQPIPNMKYEGGEGLLSILFRNETNVIPKVEISRLIGVDFTLPLWLSRHQFYIHYDKIHDRMWMTKIFSWDTWCIIFTMHILFTVFSFCSQTLLTRIRNEYRNTDFSEHLFYNFGMFCNQSYIPDILNGRSKLLEISLGLFCSIISMAYGALLFIYMTKTIFVPPFNDFNTLVNKTNYNVVALNGSVGSLIFKITPENSKETTQSWEKAKKMGRFISISTTDEMDSLACSNGKYVLFQSEEDYYTRKRIICNLRPVGEPVFKVWISSGLARNFTYKKSINLGILKLMESGLLKKIKNHWLTSNDEIKINTIEAININQVLLMIAVMGSGVLAALVVLIIEKVVYAYKFKRNLS